MIYVQRYVSPDIVDLIEFQVVGGQLQIETFGREEVKFLSLIVMVLAHDTYGGWHISLPLTYYVDSLVTSTQLIRWSVILLQWFCFSLDWYHSFVNGRLHFPISSQLYTFSQRFNYTILTLIHRLPPRPTSDACMHMWHKVFPKRGQLEWLCSVVDKDNCDFLASKDDHDVLDLVLYPYVGMDQRGYMNIQFTEDQPPDDRGNIIVMF